jgi:glycosyltransferase involved in cell wall biosynthesis
LDANVAFPGRLAVQQRVLPLYRANFFKLLARSCQGGMSIFSGRPLPEEEIKPCDQIDGVQLYHARNHHLFQTSSPLYRCWQDGILEWLEEWNPDALIVEANPRFPNTSKAIAWMHAHRRPVLGWGLGAPTPQGIFSVIRGAARRKLFNSLDGIIAYSHHGAKEYRQFGIPAERVFTALNAVVPRPQFSAPIRPAQFINRPKVLFVGRLQGRKRLDLLFQACAGLPVHIQPDIWIVGDGPARLNFESDAASIYPHVEFFGGLYDKELDNLFLNADIFVLPGTGGLAIQQAMSFGLPIIAARGDGTQEDLVLPENGWNVTPGDLSALKSALAEALGNPVQLRHMGAESYRIVAEKVNLECMVEKFIGALNSIPHFGSDNA